MEGELQTALENGADVLNTSGAHYRPYFI